MTSDPLAAARARFWRSAILFYEAITQMHGLIKASHYARWEHAQERLLDAARRARREPTAPAELPPLPTTFVHRCPACGILQAGREVCAECVALYGSAVAALAAARGRKEHDLQDTSSRFPVAPLSRLVVEEAITARRELCARMRDLLARHGRIHLSTTAALLGIGYHMARAVLGDIMAGSDGQPPIKVKMVREGRIIYWEVGE
jgi:hypothetical protein